MNPTDNLAWGFSGDCLGETDDLVIALDTLVAGVHFPFETSAADVGYKSLAVNLSDLAAMGAEPVAACYALGHTTSQTDWRQEFEYAIEAYAAEHGIAVSGRSSELDALSVSVQVFGRVPRGQSLSRAGASPGDCIMVTGTLGDAGIGLELCRGHLQGSGEDKNYLLGRLNRPTPRLAEAVAVRALVSAAIDVSDGLLADLGHILEHSRCGAVIDVDTLPVSQPASRVAGAKTKDAALAAGDDYELCFTCPPQCVEQIQHDLVALGTPVSMVGYIEARAGLRLTTADGTPCTPPATTGWQHFT